MVTLTLLHKKNHPISGASVQINDKNVGVTDAFGQWSDEIILDIESHHKISVSKETYFGSILKGDHLLIIDKKTKKLSQQNVAMTLKEIEKPKKVVQKIIEKVCTHCDDQLFFQRVWFQVKNKHSKILTKTLQQLKRKSLQNSISVRKESPWQIKIDIIKNQNPGLIKVVSTTPSYNQYIDFLLNISKNPREMAQKIITKIGLHIPIKYPVVEEKDHWLIKRNLGFWLLSKEENIFNYKNQLFSIAEQNPRDHIFVALKKSKKNPCPKNKNRCWLKKKGILKERVRKNFKVIEVSLKNLKNRSLTPYIAGYRAIKSRKNKWWFWAPKKGYAMLSVIQQGKLVLRRKLNTTQKVFNL